MSDKNLPQQAVNFSRTGVKISAHTCYLLFSNNFEVPFVIHYNNGFRRMDKFIWNPAESRELAFFLEISRDGVFFCSGNAMHILHYLQAQQNAERKHSQFRNFTVWAEKITSK